MELDIFAASETEQTKEKFLSQLKLREEAGTEVVLGNETVPFTISSSTTQDFIAQAFAKGRLGTKKK